MFYVIFVKIKVNKMKKIFLKFIVLVVLLSSSIKMYSQIEITPFGGYFYSTNINFYQGVMKIYDGGAYGGHIGVHTVKNNIVEFTYIGNKTSAEWRPYSGFSDYPRRDIEISSNYFLLGTAQDIPLNGNVTGFGTIKAGAGYFKALEGGIEDIWRFSVAFGIGAKIFFTDRIGLRIQANMNLPLYFNGVGAYCGIGSGGSNCGLSMNSTSAILQGDISTGIIFKIGKE